MLKDVTADWADASSGVAAIIKAAHPTPASIRKRKKWTREYRNTIGLSLPRDHCLKGLTIQAANTLPAAKFF
ncbi:hypothetical protein GCM10009081_25090 [Brevundimonas nasdae]